MALVARLLRATVIGNTVQGKGWYVLEQTLMAPGSDLSLCATGHLSAGVRI